MKEGENQGDYFQLIHQYLSGNASDLQVKQLEDWVLSSPENKTQFQAYKNAWVMSGLDPKDQQVDVEQEWLKTNDRLFNLEKVVPLKKKDKGRMVFLARIAAAAAVLFLFSVWIFQFLNPDDSLKFATKDEVKENTLPDGSQLALNQFSTITFSQDKKDLIRMVNLTGDAFFEVERDSSHPFVITTQSVEIEVLGTAFYVDSREDLSEIQVIVQEGTVSMTAGNEQVILTANEVGIYDKTSGELIEKPNEDVNYMAWRTEVLVFENANLESVLFDLNRKFHSSISFEDPELKSCEVTATFDHQSLEAIIKIIEKTLDLQAEKKGEVLIFSGEGCD